MMNSHQPSFDARLKNITANLNPEEFDDKHKSRLETLRLATKNFFTNTVMGQFYNQLILLISVLSCFQFIWQTYLGTNDGSELIVFFAHLELAVALVFVLDWLVLLFVADHRITFITRYFYIYVIFDLVVHLFNIFPNLVSFLWWI